MSKETQWGRKGGRSCAIVFSTGHAVLCVCVCA